MAGSTSATISAAVRAVDLRVLVVVHESEQGKGGEVARLTVISREQTTRSEMSWCGGDGEGDLRRRRFGRGQHGGFGARERSGLGLLEGEEGGGAPGHGGAARG